MNDFDDPEEYSSSNSFRARSNTWPLNRPDLALPSGVCIDETLPEIELEDDDLFTTNENWSTGLGDHDIMSWDPILNANSNSTQHQYQLQRQAQNQVTSTVHHHHQQAQPEHASHQTQSSILQHPQQQLHQHHHHHQQPPQQQHEQQQQHLRHHDSQQHDAILGSNSVNSNTMIMCRTHMQHQSQPQHTIHPPTHQHHQTLNGSHYLDVDDPNDYHLQQLHNLHLDNNQSPTDYQTSYVSSISPMSAPGQQPNLATVIYNISSDHQHNLHPLTSARYDQDPSCESDYKTNHEDDNQQLENHLHHQNQHHHIHHLTSSSLDNNSGNSLVLSSSLSTSGICLSTDLEDLDYKPVDPSTILQNPSYEESPHDLPNQIASQKQQVNEIADEITCTSKQSSSTTSSKTKLNTPRRNAWGNMSYADLISQAINSTNDKRLTLSQIYEWMVQHVPYFKDKGDSNSSAGWKNSVRHNLSLHSRFKRLQNEGTGKSSWWTINPEANIGKCARRRAASMEASKFEKKRGRAKKRAEAIRQGLVSYPSLTDSSLNGSANALEKPSQLQHQQLSTTQFGPQRQSPQMDQYEAQQQPQQQQQAQQPQLQSISQFGANQPQLQQHIDGSNPDSSHNRQPNTGLYVTSTLKSQYEHDPRYTIVMSK